VASGEHLTGIARHYGTTIEAIVAANGIVNPSYIRAGQRLVIPGAVPAAAPSPTPAPAVEPATPAPVAFRTHRVASGEHLTGIARHYGTTIEAIVAANGIVNPRYIRVGQMLRIPTAGAAPSAPASRPLPASMAARVAARDDVRRLIVAEARRFGVPTSLALAVAWQESGWRQDVVSHAGAVGVMQLLPTTGDWIGEAMLGERVDVHERTSNIHAGVRLLGHYLDRYHGDRGMALAAYYQGQTAVDRHGIYPVSRPYIASILRLERLFR
jgi:soluble lytic murein transglycosylase-like protein